MSPIRPVDGISPICDHPSVWVKPMCPDHRGARLDHLGASLHGRQRPYLVPPSGFPKLGCSIIRDKMYCQCPCQTSSGSKSKLIEANYAMPLLSRIYNFHTLQSFPNIMYSYPNIVHSYPNMAHPYHNYNPI